MTGRRGHAWRLDRYRDELHTVAGEIGPGPFSLLQTLASGGMKGAGFLDKDTLLTRGSSFKYADALGRSHRSIQYWLAELVAVGLLVKVWTGGSHRSGKKMASRYRAVMPGEWLADRYDRPVQPLHGSADGTAGQTYANQDLRRSDQGFSDRPTQGLRPTYARAAYLPQEVRRRDGAQAPPSGPTADGDGEDVAVERVDFDHEEFIENVYNEVDAILAGTPSDVAESLDDQIRRLSQKCHSSSNTDPQYVGYLRHQGAKLIRRATKLRDEHHGEEEESPW